MTQKMCKPERICGIKTPIYCWRWNDKSVVRKDNAEDYILDTYDHLIRQRIAMTEEFIKRGMMEDALTAIVKTVCDAYYDCQQYTWQKPENRELLHKAENWFAAYLKRYANYYIKANPKLTAELAQNARENALKKGTFFMEKDTLKEWLQHIMDTAKPIPEWEQNV
jgi:predicted DNA-binding protein (MmcQ/YjbR family)